MIEQNFEKVVAALGKPEAEVIAELGLLPDMKYPTEDESFFFDYKPEKGVEFVFDSETFHFIKVHILLRPSPMASHVYTGALPLGISLDWNREKAHSILGQPTKSWPANNIPTIGDVGGCDSFTLTGHERLELFIGYSTSGDIDQISVMHKNRPV
ncbi:DUF6392 family protein [Pseudomonas baltica]|uniref:DUF6392 family protein n=1 Tax=Pseudomonas baltica TaxID=2762576 RepID=UPI0028A227C9|nr:DUF6392 family protein [Pseudomonas baltica]